MDIYVVMFWVGVATLVLSHIPMLQTMPRHATIALLGTALMFVGSKLGREFLGMLFYRNRP
jgi:hypothetical protein